MPIVEAMMVIQEMQRAGYGDSRMADVFGPPEFESWASSAAILHGWPMDLCRKAWIAARDKERERCSNVCLSLADVQSERARAEGNECAKERSIQATQCAAQIWRTVT